MRLFLILWLGPIATLGLWYGLASNDLHFGIFIFSREIHDEVFRIYGAALGMAPESLPPLVAKAIVVDSFVLLAIIAFRKRKILLPWFQEKYAGFSHSKLTEAEPAPSAE